MLLYCVTGLFHCAVSLLTGLCHCAVLMLRHCTVYQGCVIVLCNSAVCLPAGVEPLSYYLLNGFLNFNVIFFLALLSLPVLVSAAPVFCDLRVNTCPLSISACQCCSCLAGDLYVSMCPLSVSKHQCCSCLAGDLCVSMCPLSVSEHRLATALLQLPP